MSADLPDSTSIVPRPVEARRLAREQGILLGPTLLQVEDAKDVLTEMVAGDPLAEEALRILLWYLLRPLA